MGPNPSRLPATSLNGDLQVFSAEKACVEGNSPSWFQHTDYRIFNIQHRLLKSVDNSGGYYSESPRTIALPPGRYLIEARARDLFLVEVPVVIQRGKLTRVHLDDKWAPPPGTASSLLCFTPEGHPIGWAVRRAN